MFSSGSSEEAIKRFLKEEIRKICIETVWNGTFSLFKLKLLGEGGRGKALEMRDWVDEFFWLRDYSTLKA